MKLIVFGATGGTGKQVVEQALQAGHHVTVIIRNPAAFPLQHSQLTVHQGNVLQPLDLDLRGADAVISCLGIHKREVTTVYSEGINNIARAMRNAGITRIICISSIAVVVPPRSSWLIKLVTKYILQRLFSHLYVDMLRMEAVLREFYLDWTVIRPPQLTDTKHTGNYRTAINEPI